MIKPLLTILFITHTLVACQSSAPRTEADLILRGANVYTLDVQNPWAQSIAIANGTIIAVGSEQQVSVYQGESTRVMNLAANFTAAWAYPDKWVTELNLPVLGTQRVDRMYPIASIVRAGGVVVGGSDWIYGPLDPLESIEVAITRQDPNDSAAPLGNVADALDLETALKAYTINAAWLMYQEKSVGSIEVGKRADLVILDRNLFEISTTEISEAKVRFTLFDGEIVYRAPQEN